MSEDVNIYYSFNLFYLFILQKDRINILLCNRSTCNVNIWIIFQYSPLEIDLQISMFDKSYLFYCIIHEVYYLIYNEVNLVMRLITHNLNVKLFFCIGFGIIIFIIFLVYYCRNYHLNRCFPSILYQ